MQRTVQGTNRIKNEHLKIGGTKIKWSLLTPWWKLPEKLEIESNG